MRKIEIENKIKEAWDNGETIQQIVARGYNSRKVLDILDAYTKKKAKKWLKK